MDTTTVSDQSSVVNEAGFIGLARDYRAARALVDALSKLSDNERDSAVLNAESIIGRLEAMSENGADYTPKSAFGFGSENAANIANAVLGRRTSSGKIKSGFSKLGRV